MSLDTSQSPSKSHLFPPLVTKDRGGFVFCEERLKRRHGLTHRFSRTSSPVEEKVLRIHSRVLFIVLILYYFWDKISTFCSIYLLYEFICWEYQEFNINFLPKRYTVIMNHYATCISGCLLTCKFSA